MLNVLSWEDYFEADALSFKGITHQLFLPRSHLISERACVPPLTYPLLKIKFHPVGLAVETKGKIKSRAVKGCILSLRPDRGRWDPNVHAVLWSRLQLPHLR